MPTLRYVGNASRFRLTNTDVDVAQGETVDVDEETAEYLLENGTFERVDGGEEGAGEDAGDEPEPRHLIEDGVCPWCPPDDCYEGDAVSQHAASAHPDAWDDYTED